MRGLVRLLAAWVLLVVPSPALELQSVNDVSQDGQGVVWVIGHVASARYTANDLVAGDGMEWRPIHCPGLPSSVEPVTTLTLHDGAILCVWSIRKTSAAHPYVTTLTKLLLSKHKGDQAALFAEIDLTKNDFSNWSLPPQPIEDSDGCIWLFGANKLWWVDTSGAPHLARMFTTRDLVDSNGNSLTPLDANGTTPTPGAVPGLCDDSPSSDVAPIEGSVTDVSIGLMQDLRGSIWATGRRDYSWSKTLKEPLCFAKHEQTAERIREIPAGSIQVLIPQDQGHLWALLQSGALFEVALATMEATPLREPEPECFHDAFAIARRDNSMFVATCAIEGSDEDPPHGLHRKAGLWELTDGVWRHVLQGLDGDDAPDLGTIVSDEHETFIGRFAGGLWRISRSGDSRTRIDWRYGIKLDSNGWLYRLPSKKLLLLAGSGSSSKSKIQTIPLPATPLPEPIGLLTFRLRAPMVQDRDGRLWRVPLATADSLECKDRGDWERFPFPDGFSAAKVARLAVDTLNRIWVLPDETAQHTAVFDGKSRRWDVYPTLEMAYQAHLPRRSQFHFEADWLSPVYSTDERIAFSHPRTTLHYFSKGRWNTFDSLMPQVGSQRVVIRPYFNRAGSLAWNYSEGAQLKSMALGQDNGFDGAPVERQPWDPVSNFLGDPDPLLPRGAVTKKADSAAQDRFGGTWFVSERRLYHARPGVCMEVLGAEQANPFSDGRSIDGAFVAPDGETFLLTNAWYRGEYVRLGFPEPLPKTIANGASVGKSSVKITFRSDIPSPRWFQWRLDGGAWSDPLASGEIVVDGLPHGNHRFEIAALDRWLRADPNPVSLPVTIAVSDRERLSLLIPNLSDADYEVREAAVQSLARFPANTLPALRTARTTAGPDLAWWIDAAIRESEANERADQPYATEQTPPGSIPSQ